MSKAGKICLVFSLVALVILLVTRITLGGWHDGMWLPLGLFVAFLIFGLVRDWRGMIGFFGMRTTKHGMNMGALIAIAIAGLVAVNYLAARYEKTFDLSRDHLNSLSDQSVKAVEGLKGETKLVLLYRKDMEDPRLQREVRDLATQFTNVSKKLTYETYNALQRPDLATKYEFTTGPFAFVAVQGDKKLRIDPATEEGITRALIKLGRDTRKTLYIVGGHGERDLASTGPEGLSAFKEELSVIYDVKPLQLLDTKYKVPDDAAAIAIVGPQQQFLDSELQAVRDYAKRGGHVLIALDPGLRHNLALLTKSFGVEFANNFILDARSEKVGAGATVIPGSVLSKESEITKGFGYGSYAVFMLGSAVKKAPETTFEVLPIVSTDESTMAIDQPQERVDYQPNGPHALAMSVRGQWPDGKEFTAVIVGDSDFLSNNIFHSNLNRDLALNSLAWLAADKDLISIRPKVAAGTDLQLTAEKLLALILLLLLPLPILMASTGGWVWWRRKTA